MTSAMARIRSARALLLVLALACVIAAAGASNGQAPMLRPPSEWTFANPATLPEIEAQIAKHRGETLTYSDGGGSLQEAFRTVYLKPLEQKFGIKFLEDSVPTNAKVRAMGDSGNVTWDIVNIGTFAIWSLGKAGYLEELDHRVVDTRRLLKTTLTPWAAGGNYSLWGTVLVYKKGAGKPRNWADFWDAKNFPGRRGYGDFITGHLEIPLLASGMAPSKITLPPNKATEEAMFRKLEELAPEITVYWHTGEQCGELLLSGDLDYCTAWNGRIYDSQKQGAPLEVCWDCGWVAGTNGDVIPKGSKHKELAQLVIAWTTFLPNIVQLTKYISYAPALDASAVPDEMRLLRTLLDPQSMAEVAGSPSNRRYMVAADERWEGENFDRLNTRYQAIFAKHK